MALQSSGQISLANIAAEHGGSAPHSLSEYYGDGTGVPTSGQIRATDFYGTIGPKRYWRWYITGNKNDTQGLIQVAEWDWMYKGSVITNPTPTNPGGSNPANELPSDAVDNNVNSKWLDFNFGGVLASATANNGYSILQFDFGTATYVDGYRWYTANDAHTRDPDDWTIQYSTNGTSWTTAHTVTNAGITTTRLTLAGTWSF